MIRYALLIQYDGTEFNGWQVQDKGRTVQEEFEKALRVLFKEEIRVTASGRTDSGVHAIGQVIHFDKPDVSDLRKICISLNGILPHDVSVKNCYIVPDDFHSRFSAVSREYFYLIYNYPLRTPFMKYRSMWINHDFDTEYFNEVASYLIGEHDFASFCKKVSADNGTVRNIESINAVRDESLIKITFRANAFLHNMIRIIVGTIVQMYREGREPGYIRYILEKKDREGSGFTAPSYGLYLKSIDYDPPLDFYKSAF